ncbi:MAG: MBL fold metallo-hydrolase [Sarcina sp.]
MDRNVKTLNSKKYKVEPLFTESDTYLTMNSVVEKEQGVIHELNSRVSYKFVPAGHILGSCQLILYVKTLSGSVKKIHVTSDLGSEHNKAPFVEDKEIVSNSSVSIFEGTYNDLERGFKNKKEVEKERNKLISLIKKDLEKNRRILIGAFAQGRNQNMQVFLYEAFKDDPTFDTPIYVDGKLCLQLNNVYQHILKDEDKEYFREVLSWKNFIYVNDYEKSLSVALNRDKKIVISGGGMLSQGRIVNHLKTLVEDREATIITTGYCGEGTIGRELQRDDNKTIKIEGLEYKKKCKVVQLSTWSSHIMAEENIKYMSQINTPMIILHHSDDNKYEFRDLVETELRKRNNSAKIICADEDNNTFFI